MDFWKNAADSVTKAVDFVVDKNRKAAMMNRLKIVIRNEREAQAHAYIQLGKYYYRNFRDGENGDTEPFCTAVDVADKRLRRAYAKLDELAMPTRKENEDDAAVPPSGDAECSGMADDSEEEDGNPEEEEESHPKDQETPPAPQQESADDDENYLHPFTVVPNDGTQQEEKPEEEKPPFQGSEPNEDASEDDKPE